MTESRQPTHHGYAVNVKDHQRWDIDTGPLSDDEMQAIYDQRGEDFWELAQDVAQDHGFQGVYSEGRMGGWAQPYPQPSDEYSDEEFAAFEREHFRPFERDILALMEACREEFANDLAEAVESANREPAERAHWEARDVVTI